MRIIRGKLKSRRLNVPKGFDSRPTTNFAKEGLFNIIDNRIDLEKAEVLDLCSGTGNISLEFVSGGAKRVIAIDQNYRCVKFLHGLSKELKIEDELQVLKQDIHHFIENTPLTFDVIFADPPYDVTFHHKIAQTVFDRSLLNEDGWLIIEHNQKVSFEDHPKFVLVKNYGTVHFSFLQD
ncbi:MAG: 16S rRNA (guanine966-N2)-methyltransferase [Lentimonas sp.]|jgi:16S rRNA (guanine966-N2)-methyltransferase